MKSQTIREEARGTLTLRLVQDKAGTIKGVVLPKTGGVHSRVEGSDPTEVWERLVELAAQASGGYFGFDGARTRFLAYFPQGFQDPRYLKKEREYKEQARTRLANTLPLESAERGEGFGEAALAAYRSTDLLHPIEKTRLQSVLRGLEADRFIHAAASFALDGGEPALLEMKECLARHEIAKWTAVTYLPFLWRPTGHMFLKPHVTQEFAARVGHPFQYRYSPALEMGVYESLLDLAAKTWAEIAALKPRDRIDLQSFIWVVGAYAESDRPATA